MHVYGGGRLPDVAHGRAEDGPAPQRGRVLQHSVQEEADFPISFVVVSREGGEAVIQLMRRRRALELGRGLTHPPHARQAASPHPPGISTLPPGTSASNLSSTMLRCCGSSCLCRLCRRRLECCQVLGVTGALRGGVPRDAQISRPSITAIDGNFRQSKEPVRQPSLQATHRQFRYHAAAEDKMSEVLLRSRAVDRGGEGDDEGGGRGEEGRSSSLALHRLFLAKKAKSKLLSHRRPEYANSPPPTVVCSTTPACHWHPADSWLHALTPVTVCPLRGRL